MGQPTPLPFAGGFYASDSLPISSQACINFYPVIEEGAALQQETLRGTPGISTVVAAGSGVTNRGAHTMAGEPYFVQGTGLYRLESNDTVTSLGTIAGTGRVSMADNGTQLMICVPGSTGYIFTTGPDTLTTISDTDYTTTNGVPQVVVFVDSFFAVTTDTDKIKISDANDGTAWDALKFGSAESSPDGITAPIVYRNQLFVGGERTTEAFTNTGGSGFPFTRTGLFLDKGFASKFSVVNAPDTFIWVGSGKDEQLAVWKLSGNTPEKVSTRAIDKLFKGLTTTQIADIYGLSYGQAGNYFVAFTLPTTTIVYDLTTGKWHERKSTYSSTTNAWRATSITSGYGKTYVGDAVNENIGELSTSVYAEQGLSILRSFSTQPYQNNQKPFSVPMIELTMEAGVGINDTSAPEDEEPVVYFEQSRDGKTWSEARGRNLGRIGEYYRRMIWRRNGIAKQYISYRFSMSSRVPAVVAQLTAELVI